MSWPGLTILPCFAAEDAPEELGNSGPQGEDADDDHLGELGDQHAELGQEAGLGGGDHQAAGDQARQAVLGNLVAGPPFRILAAGRELIVGQELLGRGTARVELVGCDDEIGRHDAGPAQDPRVVVDALLALDCGRGGPRRDDGSRPRRPAALAIRQAPTGPSLAGAVPRSLRHCLGEAFQDRRGIEIALFVVRDVSRIVDT